jgi:plasmid stabilization system protein ParE
VHLKVIWSDFAEARLDNILQYYYDNASEKVAAKIVRNIILKTSKLIENPYIGKIEELLSDREESYRYLVGANYKIIYSVDEENHLIKIADVFDTRQNPVKLKRNL